MPGPKDAGAPRGTDPSLPTGTAPTPYTPSPARSGSAPSTASGFSTTPQGRFAAGSVLNERYRILGLLGRGGMGEVYRADDLLLGEAVALKFLPEGLGQDPERLERFRNEVRIARQISHPVVCRVHDLGTADGHPFLSMEYIDGENLKSLLRRIGRMPGDKALEMSRRLAAGLAAAHDRGVQHRDLKPENVMIDGQGNVRITDFGLAALADTVSGHDVRSGTPAYMSPEQLAGREVTVASDVYALGLVLYELFTGKRAFTGRSLRELMQQHAESGVTTPSSLVTDMDPAVERIILRCLEKDPAQRPASALAVAAALPGADPLAAALAAGETPSPELVAAAGRTEGIAPARAWAGLVFALVGLVAVPLVSSYSILEYVPMELPPPAAEARARQILRELGYEPGVDHALGTTLDLDYFRHVEASDQSPQRWDRLASGRPAVVSYWYRESPHPLVSDRTSGRVGIDDPPRMLSGMTLVRLDGSGRLVELAWVPPEVDEPGPSPAPEAEWRPLFALAGLDLDRFTPVESRRSPPSYADARVAWTGSYPDRPELELRVEAASYRGRPVHFNLLGEWSRAWRMEPFAANRDAHLALGIIYGVMIAVLSVASILARRHWRMGRGDRRGAQRLATLVGLGNLAAGMLLADHTLGFGEVGIVFRLLGESLLTAGIIWMLYLAVEPYVRRQWPHRLIAWTRLLSGGWRDPLVGRDVVVGTCMGAAMALLVVLVQYLPERFGAPPQRPIFGVIAVLLGTPETLSTILGFLLQAVFLAMGFMVLAMLLRLILRREWAAAAALILLMGLQQAFGMELEFWLAFPFGLLIWTLPIVVLLRYGLLAFSAGLLVIFLVANLPLTSRLDHWTAAPTLWVLAVVGGVALWGFYTSLGGRSPFGDSLDS